MLVKGAQQQQCKYRRPWIIQRVIIVFKRMFGWHHWGVVNWIQRHDYSSLYAHVSQVNFYFTVGCGYIMVQDNAVLQATTCVCVCVCVCGWGVGVGGLGGGGMGCGGVGWGGGGEMGCVCVCLCVCVWGGGGGGPTRTYKTHQIPIPGRFSSRLWQSRKWRISCP